MSINITKPPYTWIKWGVGAVPIVLFAVWVGLNMHSLGNQIVWYLRNSFQPNLAMDYTMGVFWWIVCALIILVLKEETRRMLFTAWVGKFVVVLVAMLFYEQQYGLDAYTYYETAVTGTHWMYEGVDFRKDPIPSLRAIEKTDVQGAIFSQGIGTENALRFMVLMRTLVGPWYHAMKVGFAFLGLVGTWWFYRAAVVALGHSSPKMFYLLAFFPSILFWSSILGKDSLQFLFLGLYAYGGMLWIVQGRLISFGYLGLGLFGSYLLRPWIAMMCVVTLGVAMILCRGQLWQKSLVVLCLLPLAILGNLEQLGMSMGLDIINSNPEQMLEMLQARGEASSFGGKSGAELPTATGVAALPVAMFSGLFRPLPFDISSAVIALSALENTIVLGLALRALVSFRLAYLRDPLLLWPILFCLMWSVLYGFVVMANFGAGVRYRLQIWPFLLMIVVALTHREGRALLDQRARGRNL